MQVRWEYPTWCDCVGIKTENKEAYAESAFLCVSVLLFLLPVQSLKHKKPGEVGSDPVLMVKSENA